jgi:hypothetical protein
MVNILPLGFNRKGKTGIYTPNTPITLQELYTKVTSCQKLQSLTEKARVKVAAFKHYKETENPDETKLNQLAEEATNAKIYGLPHLQPSFNSESFSGFLHIDIDNVVDVKSVFDNLCTLDCISFAARTVSGKGIFCLVKVDLTNFHTAKYQSLLEAFSSYSSTLNIPKNDIFHIGQTRAIASDKFAYLNLTAKNFEYQNYLTEEEKVKSKRAKKEKDTQNTVDFCPVAHDIDKNEVLQALKFLIAKNANFAECYNDYFQTFAACCYVSGTNSEAYDLTDEVLKASLTYQVSDFKLNLRGKDCEKASTYSPIYILKQAQKLGFIYNPVTVETLHLEGLNVAHGLSLNNIAFKDLNRSVLVAPTGSGKSWYIRSIVEKGLIGEKIVLCVPTNQLCKEVAAEAKISGIECEIWDGANKRDANLCAVFFVCTYNSFLDLVYNLDCLGTVKNYNLILDEAHGVGVDTYKTDKDNNSIFAAICTHLDSFKSVVGLTATPVYFSKLHPLHFFKTLRLKITATSVKKCFLVQAPDGLFLERCRQILQAIKEGRFILLHLNSKGANLDKYKNFLVASGVSFRLLNADTKKEDALLELVNNKVIEGVQVYICTNVIREGVSIKNIKEVTVISCDSTASVNDLEQVANRFRETNINLVVVRNDTKKEGAKRAKRDFFSFEKTDAHYTDVAAQTAKVLTLQLQHEVIDLGFYNTKEHEAARTAAGLDLCFYNKNLLAFTPCASLVTGAINKDFASYVLECKERTQQAFEGFGWTVAHIEGTGEILTVTKEKGKSNKEVISEVKRFLIEGVDVVLCKRGEVVKTKIEGLCKKHGQEVVFRALDKIETSQQLTKLDKRLKFLSSKSGVVKQLIDTFRVLVTAAKEESEHGGKLSRTSLCRTWNEAREAVGLHWKKDCWHDLQLVVEVTQSKDIYVVKLLDFYLDFSKIFTTVNPLIINKLTGKSNTNEVLSFCPF